MNDDDQGSDGLFDIKGDSDDDIPLAKTKSAIVHTDFNMPTLDDAVDLQKSKSVIDIKTVQITFLLPQSMYNNGELKLEVDENFTIAQVKNEITREHEQQPRPDV